MHGKASARRGDDGGTHANLAVVAVNLVNPTSMTDSRASMSQLCQLPLHRAVLTEDVTEAI